MRIKKLTCAVSPASKSSFLLTSALSGNRYVPDFLSGKIEVSHDVFPIVTDTGSEPHPRPRAPYAALMAADSFLGTVTKCHAAFPGYSHMLRRKLYGADFFLMVVRCAHECQGKRCCGNGEIAEQYRKFLHVEKDDCHKNNKRRKGRHKNAPAGKEP